MIDRNTLFFWHILFNSNSSSACFHRNPFCFHMDILPAEDTLKEIQPVSDDIEERLEKLRRRELLPANVLIELCDKVLVGDFSHFLGKRNNT